VVASRCCPWVFRTAVCGKVFLFSKLTFFFCNHEDAACVVCEVDTDDVLMVPGPWTCPNNYDILYTGWVAASFRDHTKPFTYVRQDGRFWKRYDLDNGFFYGRFAWILPLVVSSDRVLETKMAH
jgi:hypothetical protein